MASIPESRRPKYWYFETGSFFLSGSSVREKEEEMWFCEQSLQESINFPAQDDDIFIVTYPKNGTTWTQQIVYCLLNDGKPPQTALNLLSGAHSLKCLEAK